MALGWQSPTRRVPSACSKHRARCSMERRDGEANGDSHGIADGEGRSPVRRGSSLPPAQTPGKGERPRPLRMADRGRVFVRRRHRAESGRRRGALKTVRRGLARPLAPLLAVGALCWGGYVCAADFPAAVEAYAKGDYERAFALFQELADAGDARAQYRLAQLLANGTGTPRDGSAALHWYRQAAQGGSTEAQSELALMYLLGRGVRQDHTWAAYWYGQLADDGHGTAQIMLGGMYEEGKGVARDLSRAAFWYRRAAEQGFATAQAKLGAMYADGRGVPQNLVQAWVWFDLAAAGGQDEAARERTRISVRLDAEELAAATELSRELRPLSIARPGPDEAVAVAAPGMIAVEPGCLTMGSSPDELGRHDNEAQHQLCVEGFYLSRYEVTRGQFAEFVGDTGFAVPEGCHTHRDGTWQFRPEHNWREPGFFQNDTHPVVCVSREDADAFAAWLSERHGRDYRLPNEAEWEYAARAGSEAARHWGDGEDQACSWGNVGDDVLRQQYADWSWDIHRCDDGYTHTAPVGSYRTSPFGLHDMLGNVWEWTCSSYEPVYGGAESRCAQDDRGGVVRGGSWSNSPGWVRSSARFPLEAQVRFDLVGFRLVHD